MSDPGEITRLLHAYRDGDGVALERLIPLVYDDLKRIASRVLRARRAGETLSATVVVHEAWLKLSKRPGASWNDRGHFLAVSATAMRQVVIDYARERQAAKRGGGVPFVTVDDEAHASHDVADWVLSVDQALGKLSKHDQDLARIVECRFFGGYSEQETAEALGVSVRTVQRGWPRARAWLKEALRSKAGQERSGALG